MSRGPRILLDIARTISRSRLPAPTGIDRVEQAYIDWAFQNDAMFLAGVGGPARILSPDQARTLLQRIETIRGRYARLGFMPERTRKTLIWTHVKMALFRGGLGTVITPDTIVPALRQHFPNGGVYLNTGHDNLLAPVMEAIGEAGLKRMVLLHDAIPYDYPQYTRPGTPEKFRTKLEATCLADGLLFNSHHTAERVLHHLGRMNAPTQPWHVAPLGIETLQVAPTQADQPCFLCLGTIEPRKNHAMLLDIWERLGPQAPTLHIVGRRGWNNEEVFRRLDARPAQIIEEGAVDDHRLAALMGGATAILFPSFAEGYGLPVAEALAAGVPVLSSDLPALREVGGDVPEWLTPDAPDAWHSAILAYAAPASPARKAQFERMQTWSPPSWDAHFRIVENALETILVQSGQAR